MPAFSPFVVPLPLPGPLARLLCSLSVCGALVACQSSPSTSAAHSLPATSATPVSTQIPPPDGRLAHADLPRSALLNRLTWGVERTSLDALTRMGPDAYLDAQLKGGPARLPDAIQARIDAMRITRTPLTTLVPEMERQHKQAKAQKGQDDGLLRAYHRDMNQLGEEAALRAVLRAVYSPNQLYEQMCWFWMNHFSIHQGKHDLRAMVGDFEERAIRPYALGHFRDLLRATVLHPAMLRYLDNEHNADGHINENYARELMELHTLGVQGGYSQADVQALAHILTGLGVARDAAPSPHASRKGAVLQQGLTQFQSARHDYSDKTLLGRPIRGSGFAEIEDVITLLARQPATARFISRKLAEYFVSDTPPEALVEQAAQTFLRTDGDLAATLHTLLVAPETFAALGGKFKDPLHYVVSATRALYDGAPLERPQALLAWLKQMGEAPNGHLTPDGYALDEPAWASPAQMTQRFEIARSMAALRQASGWDDGALRALLERQPVSQRTRQTLAAAAPNERLALWLSAPEMMRR